MASPIDAVSSSKTEVAQVHGDGGGSGSNSLIEQMLYQMLLDAMQASPQSTTDTAGAGTGGSGQPAATQVNQIN